MASDILCTPAELHSMADKCKTQAEDAGENFKSLKTQLAGMADSFRGKAATRFDERYNEWDTGALQLMEALDGLGQFLLDAAEAIEGVDERLASGLG
ncbi:hypothetical protein BH23ACT9_BH23ACT9_37090 [soil metagenome]